MQNAQQSKYKKNNKSQPKKHECNQHANQTVQQNQTVQHNQTTQPCDNVCLI